MKMQSMLTVGAVLLLSAGVAQAAHIWEEGYWSKDSNTPNFGGQELSLDLFGSYRNPEGELHDLFETSIHHGVWGGGAGLNYFFTRELGIGTDFTVSDYGANDWRVDYWVGDLYLRLPIGDTFAPYLIGSGGRGITPSWQWVYGGGVGLEVRLSPKLGVFSDARFLWADKSDSANSLTIRAGLRVSF